MLGLGRKKYDSCSPLGFIKTRKRIIISKLLQETRINSAIISENFMKIGPKLTAGEFFEEM